MALFKSNKGHKNLGQYVSTGDVDIEPEVMTPEQLSGTGGYTGPADITSEVTTLEEYRSELMRGMTSADFMKNVIVCRYKDPNGEIPSESNIHRAYYKLPENVRISDAIKLSTIDKDTSPEILPAGSYISLLSFCEAEPGKYGLVGPGVTNPYYHKNLDDMEPVPGFNENPRLMQGIYYDVCEVSGVEPQGVFSQKELDDMYVDRQLADAKSIHKSTDEYVKDSLSGKSFSEFMNMVTVYRYKDDEKRPVDDVRTHTFYQLHIKDEREGRPEGATIAIRSSSFSESGNLHTHTGTYPYPYENTDGMVKSNVFTMQQMYTLYGSVMREHGFDDYERVPAGKLAAMEKMKGNFKTMAQIETELDGQYTDSQFGDNGQALGE